MYSCTRLLIFQDQLVQKWSRISCVYWKCTVTSSRLITSIQKYKVSKLKEIVL